MLKTSALSCIIAVTLLSAACGSRPPSPSSAPPAAGARLVVSETLVADVKPVDAVVATSDLGEARARIGGSIVRLLVTENDHVRKGQLLATVSDPRIDFQTSALDAQAQAARAEAQRTAADLARVRVLYQRGFYAKARLDDAEAADKSARANLAAALAQRAASAELSSQGAVVSPGDGRVITARVPAGSVVVAGQTVVTVATGAPVLRLEIPEREAAALRVGETLSVMGDDGRADPSPAVVRKIYPAIEAGRVVADIDWPPAAGAAIGRKVTVNVQLGQRRAIVLPPQYVITRFGLDYVRLVGPNGLAAETPVQIAARAPGAPAQVLSGLQAGDVIIAPAPSARAVAEAAPEASRR
jgi:RND family efflux transporter MFP subunit